ncbi:SDR family oxidoreductase [Rhizobium leguminosarum bv. viciae]|nr:SDR family NAD(P)-dependent oxidoreductase [Rhizobium leguminosarum]TBZ21027.1 SDR family oxidoreductase [Rhizobium leguminosarum bv. viciae]
MRHPCAEPHHLQTAAAVTAFTQNFACDYAPDKIGVNAVCPGEIHTPMHDAVICALADA